jgi:hypothetical protein
MWECLGVCLTIVAVLWMPTTLSTPPATDTDGLGHSCTRADAWSTLPEASDSAGHFGWALQAGDHVQLDRVDDLRSLRLVLIQRQQTSIPKFLKLP